jgi:BirA family transcriptional regulator, biotin operon repressor / biotin---[acetyl-CoA-carboxylase] ligase
MDWPIEELSLKLKSQLADIKVELLERVDSTNEELLRRARGGDTHPCLLIAEQQTKGRGRLGKVWHSSEKDSLTFSLGLILNPVSWSGLSLVVGLGIVRALELSSRIKISLKWPNDLWVEKISEAVSPGQVTNYCKLGGILIETHSVAANLYADHSSKSQRREWSLHSVDAKYVVIGMGININAPQGLELTRGAVGLLDLDSQASRSSSLLAVIPSVLEYVLRFKDCGFEPFAREYSASDALYGKNIQMSNGLSGRALGVNILGELQIQTSDGLVSVHSHEVSLVGLQTQ